MKIVDFSQKIRQIGERETLFLFKKIREIVAGIFKIDGFKKIAKLLSVNF